MHTNPVRLLLLLCLCQFSQATRYPCDRTRSCGCGSSPEDIHASIVPGESAVPASWSMLVSIRYDLLKKGDSETHVCGGTILDHSWILTAANCFESIRDEIAQANITIAAGIGRRSQASQIIREVDEVILHPRWRSKGRNHLHDIALLRLSEPLDFQNHSLITRTCLPPRRATLEETLQYPSNNQSLVVVGWGRTDPHGNDSNTSQQISVYPIDLGTTECANETDNPYSQFCAGLRNGTSGRKFSLFESCFIDIFVPL